MFYIIIIIGIFLDLISKNLANTYLQEKINIFGNFFYLKYVENTGIAFSINIPFLKIITIILIILIFRYYIKEEKPKNNKLINIGFGLILAGAIGNGIERVLYGNVIDFIGIQYFSVFNLADSFITIGAILYLFSLYKIKGVFDQQK